MHKDFHYLYIKITNILHSTCSYKTIDLILFTYSLNSIGYGLSSCERGFSSRKIKVL